MIVTRAATLAVVLFVTRLLAETLGLPWYDVLALIAAGVGLSLLLRRLRLAGAVAPALVLWLYVLWPWRDPRLALACGVIATLALAVQSAGRSRMTLPRYALEAAVFLGALALYTLTLAPDVLPADAGEFQLVAASAAVAHPPGYPLYTLLAKAFALLPVANVAWRVNWFSAVTAAAALALTAAAARRLSGSAWGGLAAALVLGTGTSFWSTATQASIRPLTAFFTAAGVWVVVCICESARGRPQPPKPAAANPLRAQDGPAPLAAAGPEAQPAPRSPWATRDLHLTLLALVLGLGIGHHASLAFTGAFFALYVLLVDPSLLRAPRRWLAPLGAFALSLVVFAYLPLADPALRTPGAILDYVLARGFAGDMLYFVTREPALLGDRLALLPGLLAFEFQPLALLAAAAGIALLARRQWRLALALGGGWLLHTFMTLTYHAPQTVEYMLPAYVLLAVAAGRAAGWAARRVPVLAALLVALVLWSGVAQGLQNRPSLAYLAQDDDTRRTALDLLAHAPPGAAVLSNWHWYTAMRYLQQVEGARPDVLVDYVYPRGEPLADTWVNAIRATLPSRPVVVDQYFENEYGASGLRVEPLGREAWLAAAGPRTAPPGGLTPSGAEFGGRVRLLGFALDRTGYAAGDTLVLTVAWTPLAPLARDYHFFAHVLGADGVPLAQSDLVAPTSQAAPGEVLVLRHRIALPAAVAPGSYRLTAGVYDALDAGGYARLALPDGRDALPLADLTLAPGAWPLPTLHPLFLRFAGGPTLEGYDYEGTSGRLYLHWTGPARATQSVLGDALPGVPAGVAFTTVHQAAAGRLSIEVQEGGAQLARTGAWGLPVPEALSALVLEADARYVPLGGDMIFTGSTPLPARCDGAAARIDLSFIAMRPLVRDRVVSVHLAGDWYAQSDAVPALGAIPTLKWLYAARIGDRHVLGLPADGHGSALAGLVVYDAFTQEPLAVLDPDIARQGPAIALGTCER